MSGNRNTSRRDLHRSNIRKQEPPCGICGAPIDYTLPYLHPGEFVVDHIVPLAAGGADTLENKQAAHRSCNRTKGAEPGFTRPRLEPFSTTRKW